MKKKSVILTILVLIYFCITYVYSTNVFLNDGRYSISDDLKNNMIMLMNEYIDKGTIEKVKNMEKNR